MRILAAAICGSIACYAIESRLANAQEVTRNSIGMPLLRIEPGEFMMGSASPEAETDEKPVRKVRIATAFLLGQTEVTQRQFEQVMKTAPWRGRGEVKEGPDFAASYITWNAAVVFCKRLTESERAAGRLKGSLEYRLPTEAEWEYACRAGTTTTWSFGNDAASLGDHAWWGAVFGDGNAKEEQYAHAVARKKANPWGLFDMHGNVREWCGDWYLKEGMSDSSGAMKSAVRQNDASPGRVIRGGSWKVHAAKCSSSARGWWPPSNDFHSLYPADDSSGGFRVVCEVE